MPSSATTASMSARWIFLVLSISSPPDLSIELEPDGKAPRLVATVAAAASHSRVHDTSDARRRAHVARPRAGRAHREQENWRYVATKLDEAARGASVVEVFALLRMVLAPSADRRQPRGRKFLRL